MHVYYAFSELRSIRPAEINQYDLTMATHYDITMSNDVARDIHCDVTIVKSQWVMILLGHRL